MFNSVLPRHLLCRFRYLPVKTDMDNVFLVPKKFDSCSKKMSFPVDLRFISAEKKFLVNFYCIKRFVFEFQGDFFELFISQRILAVYCQLVPQLLTLIFSTTHFIMFHNELYDFANYQKSIHKQFGNHLYFSQSINMHIIVNISHCSIHIKSIV